MHRTSVRAGAHQPQLLEARRPPACFGPLFQTVQICLAKNGGGLPYCTPVHKASSTLPQNLSLTVFCTPNGRSHYYRTFVRGTWWMLGPGGPPQGTQGPPKSANDYSNPVAMPC